MIQRIQTLYLGLATLLMLVWMGRLSTGAVAVMGYEVAAWAKTAETVVWAVAIVLQVVAIFLYKKRTVQMKLCRAAIALLAAGLVVMGIDCGTSGQDVDIMRVLGEALRPAVSLCLTYMALGRIRADERLVRSVDRIR